MTEFVKQRGEFGKSPGRTPGVKNKKTELAEQAILDHIIQHNIIIRLIDRIMEMIEGDQGRLAEVVQAFKAITPYIAKTKQEEKLIEEVEEKPTKENALKLATEIQKKVIELKAVK